MASVNFLYRSAKGKSNLILRLLYRYEGKDYVFGAKTQLEIEKAYWVKQHKKRSKDIEVTNKQTEVNSELNRLENQVLNAFNSLNIESISKEWLQAQIEYYYNPPKPAKNIPTNLVDYITYYIDYRKHEIKNSSQKKFNVIKNKLERFEKYRKKQILINEVNDSFKNEFLSYCKEELYSQNTIQRELAIIKTFCKHARFLGLETHSQLDSLRLDKARVEKIYLSFEDLTKIENIAKEELTDSFDNAKDWLIISCYIGQRISDFMHFTDKQIRIEEGKHLLEFTQKKTNKLTTIPLHPKVLEILSKRNWKFPYPISDQKYNNYIKKVCELAKLNDLIIGSKKIETEPNSKVYRKKTGTYKKYDLVTSHIGRRSFATNFYGQIPTTFLINMTNHSSEAMFLNYIGKSNKDLAKETFKFF
jgi:integrase